MKLLKLFLLSFICISTAMAGTVHLNLEKSANKVLEQEVNALSLEEIKNIVVNENLDIQISYQRLLQAQKDISVARAQFFPYGTGVLFNYKTYTVLNKLLLIELITSLPTKLYTVRENKNIRTAQSYSLKALTENIKNQVAELYYGVVKQNAMVDLVGIELELLEELISSTQASIAVGITTDESLVGLKLRALSLRDDYLKFKAYQAYENMALNVLLGRDPKTAGAVKLQPVATLIGHDDIKMSTENMVASAVANSSEIKAGKFLLSAAFNSKRSTQWSILSFKGLGFGYWGRIKVSKSVQKEMSLAVARTEDKIINQVYMKESSLKNSIDYQITEEKIFNVTRRFMNSRLGEFKAGEISIDSLLETQIVYIKDYREMIMSHYTTLANLDSLERAVQANIQNEK
jgi:hypothetical protein